MKQRHDQRKVYYSLRRRLDGVQSLAREEAWATNCRVTGAPSWFAAERTAARDLKHAAMDDVQRMLTGLECSGALTRAGADAVCSVFAIACRDGAALGNHERRCGHARRLQWVWRIERVRVAVSRFVRRSAP